MVERMTDVQIARVFAICEEIAAVKMALPPAPRGFDVSLEIARNLRTSLTQHNAALVELAQLIQTADTEELGPVSPANPMVNG